MSRRRKIAKHAKLTDEEWEAQSAELRPLFIEFIDLNDNATANALNARGVSALRGGRWTAQQIGRVRERLKLDAKLWLLDHLRQNLLQHFGKDDLTTQEKTAIDHCMWAAFSLSHWKVAAEKSGGKNFASTHLREFRRSRTLLGLAIDVLRVASDEFERNHGDTTAALIWESATRLLLKLEAELAPKIATTDTASAS